MDSLITHPRKKLVSVSDAPYFHLLPSDKKKIHLSGKPSEAGADAERIGIYLQRVCHRGVSFSSAPLVVSRCIRKTSSAAAFIQQLLWYLSMFFDLGRLLELERKIYCLPKERAENCCP